ncbi:MAG: diphthine--ammonia ligase [Thermoplasmatales archaeon]|nr:MAG: diphthine--ammonia ligase [Thermoplasmatales archaeon]
MKVAVLFSGGKDSAFAAYLAEEHGHEISCFISIVSENPSSYMFHTPSISEVKKQAEVANIPIIIQKTKGEKETELKDLNIAIQKAKNKYGIDGIVTGTVESAYQASRIQKICSMLGLDCFNPLWQKNQFELLDDLIKAKFEVIITGVFAYPLDKSWLGHRIDKKFLDDVKKLYKIYKINPAGEGGEFETFVLRCPLFSKSLEIKNKKIKGKQNSWTMEIEVK